MDIPDFRALLGRPADSVETMFDLGHRAVWKVRSRADTFVVKADDRPGHTANEVVAQQHARRFGIPAPEIIGFETTSPAAVAMFWAEGVPLHAHSTTAAKRDVGRWLRAIHGLPMLRPRETSIDEWLVAWLEEELDYMVQQEAVPAADRKAALEATERLRPVLESTPSAWIHGDCQAAHFLVDPETDLVTAVLDWADAQHGLPEMDLATLTLFDADSLDEILVGYGAGDDLKERLALPLYHAARGAGSFRWLQTYHNDKRLFAVDRVKALAGWQ